MDYPPELAAKLLAQWSELQESGWPSPPRRRALEATLDAVFEASLTVEEGRPIRCRVVLADPEALRHPANQPTQFLPRRNTVKFEQRVELTAQQLRRLAPATDHLRTLIGVAADGDEGCHIWGLVDIGDSWWGIESVGMGGSSYPPPDQLIIGSDGPGNLTVNVGGTTVLTARQEATEFLWASAVLYNGPISSFFADAQQRLYDRVVSELGTASWDPSGDDDDYPSRALVNQLALILKSSIVLVMGGQLHSWQVNTRTIC